MGHIALWINDPLENTLLAIDDTLKLGKRPLNAVSAAN